MKRFDLLLKEDKSELYRVLDVQENNITVIACLHKSMPVKVLIESLSCFYKVEESKLFELTGLYTQSKTIKDYSETLLLYVDDLLGEQCSNSTNIAREPYIETSASYKKVKNGISKSEKII